MPSGKPDTTAAALSLAATALSDPPGRVNVRQAAQVIGIFLRSLPRSPEAIMCMVDAVALAREVQDVIDA